MVFDIWIAGTIISSIAILIHMRINNGFQMTYASYTAAGIIGALWFIVWPAILVAKMLEARMRSYKPLPPQFKEKYDFGPPLDLSPEEMRRRIRIVK